MIRLIVLECNHRFFDKTGNKENWYPGRIEFFFNVGYTDAMEGTDPGNATKTSGTLKYCKIKWYQQSKAGRNTWFKEKFTEDAYNTVVPIHRIMCNFVMYPAVNKRSKQSFFICLPTPESVSLFNPGDVWEIPARSTSAVQP